MTGVATSVQSDPFGDAYAPVEVDVPLLKNGGHKWFWAPNTDHLIMTTDQLMDLYYKSVGRGAVLLLNSTPDTTGLIPESHASAYRAFGDEIRRRFDTPLGKTRGEGNVIELEFPQPTEVNHVVLQENLAKGQRVLAFSVEGKNEQGEWKELYSGTSVGFKRICAFQPLRLRSVRVVVTNTKARPQISAFAAYNVSGVRLEPEKRDDRDRFYDGVASRQGTVAGQEPEVEIGTWEVAAKGAAWSDLRLDLTKHVTKVGQYEVTFAAAPGGMLSDLEFGHWELEMYGAKIDGAAELLKGRSAFRITRSQQTLDDFPTIFRVSMKSNGERQSGVITIRRLTY
jgi:alpha-L-fucosidase